LGRGHAGRARPARRHHHQARAPQRDRHAQRLLQRLPRTGRRRRGAQARAQGRPHQHLADRRHRPLPAVDRAGPHRLARSVGGAGGRRLLHRTRGRLRHPPDHRHHQGARDPAGGDRGAAERPPASSSPPAAPRW
jgi:hypothetical protein